MCNNIPCVSYMVTNNTNNEDYQHGYWSLCFLIVLKLRVYGMDIKKIFSLPFETVGKLI